MSKKIIVITESPRKKGIIDRLFSFCVAGKDIAGRERALITCCEEDDMSVMDGVRILVEGSATLMKWKL